MKFRGTLEVRILTTLELGVSGAIEVALMSGINLFDRMKGSGPMFADRVL
jgi:hypothetical protein